MIWVAAILAILAIIVVLGVLLMKVSGRASNLQKAADSLGIELQDFKERKLDDLIGQKLERLVKEATDRGQEIRQKQQEATTAAREFNTAIGSVTAQLTTLGALGPKVDELNNLLKPQQLRGALGEVIVRQVISDKLPHGSFAENHSFKDGKQVEFVITLNGRLIPIDSKLQLDAFKRVRSATSDQERQTARSAFKRTIREKIDEVHSYIRPTEGTYNFGIMVIPSEAVYYELIAEEGFEAPGGLHEYTQEKNVFMASPLTFWAYIEALAHGLKGLEIEQSAERILAGLNAISLKLNHLTGESSSLEVLGNHLRNAVKKYEEVEKEAGDLRDDADRLQRNQSSAEVAEPAST